MNISVRYKTLLLIGTTIIVAFGGFALLLRNMNVMEDRYIAQTKATVEQRINAETQKINTYMTVTQDTVAGIATAGENLLLVHQNTGMNIEEEAKAFLLSTLARYPKAVGCGLWYEPDLFSDNIKFFGPYARWDKGKLVMSMEYATPEYNYVSKPWYTQALPQHWDRKQRLPQTVYWSAPYLDDSIDTLLITVSGIMYGKDGRIIGISSLGVSMEYLREVVGSIHITPSSSAFAVDTRSKLITAFPADKALLLQPVDKLPFKDAAAILNAVKPEGQTQFSTTVDGKPTTIFYSVSPTGMGLGIAVPDAELYAEARNLAQSNQNTTLMAAGTLLALFCIIFLMLNKIIIKPILSLSVFSRSVADGKLDTPVSDNYKSEFAVLRNAMVAMLDSMKEKMREADHRTEEARISARNAESAQQAAEEATIQAQKARSEGMRQAAGSLRSVVAVADTVSDELSNKVSTSRLGAEAQSQRAMETATAMEELSAAVLEISNNTGTAAHLSEESRAAAEQGAEQVSSILRDMDTVHKDFQFAYGAVDDLSSKAHAIGAIAQTIEDIADQTNLLALNAAIEAARAGDAGRGFAVVADEVRKLAENTMAATKEVGQSITGIQQAAGGTLTSMDRTKELLGQAMNDVQGAEGMLRHIAALVMQSSDQIRTIATAAEQQSAATEEVNVSIAGISQISEETTAAMQEAARAVEALGKQTTTLKNLMAELEKG